MDLPQELIDEIISHIPLDDENSLRNCSLVAKSWVYPSRRYLFWTIDIEGATRLKSWLANIPPTNIEILQHVRSIECQIADPPDSPRPLTDLLRDYSPSFRQFERLTFFMGFLPSLTQIGTYTAFQHTLSCLRLEYCSVTAIGLVALVNYFPNLARLDLIDLYRMADDQSTTPFSRPLQKLTIAEFFTDSSLALLDGLMGLRPQCEEVAISIYWALSPSLAQRVIDGVEASVKRVNLESDLEGMGNPLSLSSCRELRELKIYAFCPGSAELNLISSITSTNIQRITFIQPFLPQESLALDHLGWTQLDNCLCRLADRLESGIRLEVEFQALNEQAWWGGELGFARYLPRFYEKGGQGK